MVLILVCLASVLNCLNFWKFLSCHHFFTLFFPDVFVPAMWTRWKSSFFMYWALFCHLCCIFKNSCSQCCLSLLIRSFWHVRCLLRSHSSYFRSFLFPQPAYFIWQGQFPAVSWSDTPTLSFSCLWPLYTQTQPPPLSTVPESLGRWSQNVLLTEVRGCLVRCWYFFPLRVFYMWMLQSFGDRSLYFLFALQNLWAQVGPWVLGPGWSVTALALGLTEATELPAQAVQRI